MTVETVSLKESFVLSQGNAVSRLAQLRRQFEKDADGESLLEVGSPLALLLWDVCRIFELSEQETITVLGKDLYWQVVSFVG